MKNDTPIFAYIFLALTVFSFFGWYMAEQDNEILRKELSTYTNKELLR